MQKVKMLRVSKFIKRQHLIYQPLKQNKPRVKIKNYRKKNSNIFPRRQMFEVLNIFS